MKMITTNSNASAGFLRSAVSCQPSHAGVIGGTNLRGNHSAKAVLGGKPAGFAAMCEDIRSFTTGTWAYAMTAKKQHSQRKRLT